MYIANYYFLVQINIILICRLIFCVHWTQDKSSTHYKWQAGRHWVGLLNWFKQLSYEPETCSITVSFFCNKTFRAFYHIIVNKTESPRNRYITKILRQRVRLEEKYDLVSPLQCSLKQKQDEVSSLPSNLGEQKKGQACSFQSTTGNRNRTNWHR